jgi:hypothetical protein
MTRIGLRSRPPPAFLGSLVPMTSRRVLAAGLGALGVAAVAAATVVLAVRSGDESEAEPEQRPGAFMEQVYRSLLVGRHGGAWDLLHPAHQAVVTRARYVECAAEWPPSPELQRFQVLEVYTDPLDVPLIPETTSTAVRYLVTVGAGSESDTFTATGHAVAVDGRWRWVLAVPDVGAFERGECPA